MELIDDEGKLFGTINVIDALVILLVLAVGAAGLAVVLPGGDTGETNPTADTGNTNTIVTEGVTRYATIDLGTNSDYVANQITTGDRMVHNGHNLTVTDVYTVPTHATNATVVVRAELEGRLIETASNGTRFEFAGNRPRVGDSLTIDTDEYVVGGSVRRLDENGSSLNTEYVTFDLKIENVDPDIAAGITEGTARTSRGVTVLTISSTTVQPTKDVYRSENGKLRVQDHPTRKDIRLTAVLLTIETESGYLFTGSPLRIGDSISLDLGPIAVDGTITGFDE